MKSVYLILSNSYSFPSKVLKYCSGNELNHLSISLDKDLNRMYSFGRKNINNFLIGGFIEEGLDTKYIVHFPNTYCEVYSLDIDDTCYDILYNMLNNFKLNKNKYSYNFVGILFGKFRYNYIRSSSYYCSQFVFYLLKECGIIDKDLNYLLPSDLKNIKNLDLIYKGNLSDYKIF